MRDREREKRDVVVGLQLQEDQTGLDGSDSKQERAGATQALGDRKWTQLVAASWLEDPQGPNQGLTRTEHEHEMMVHEIKITTQRTE